MLSSHTPARLFNNTSNTNAPPSSPSKQSPRKARPLSVIEDTSPQKRSNSAVSMHNIFGKDRSPKRVNKAEHKLKTKKSARDLAATLLRTKGSKSNVELSTTLDDDDKENRRSGEQKPPPIWAQFATTGGNTPTPLGEVSQPMMNVQNQSTPSSPGKRQQQGSRPSSSTKSGFTTKTPLSSPQKENLPRASSPTKQRSQSQDLNVDAINASFEEMLESRNVAPEVRSSMRSLPPSMKADLLRQDSMKEQATTSTVVPIKDSDTDDKMSMKSGRPRSINLSLFKGSSSPKKGSSPMKHFRNKSVESLRPLTSASTTSLESTARTSRIVPPSEFISYFENVKSLQDIEAGKIQKLRQILRNETVSWVNDFVTQGGMKHVVELLFKIMAVEWRNEHEDLLLHHSLGCLKALMTTSTAVTHIDSFESTLFPALLKMLFSTGEERKAPSEYPTRGLIISILFLYLVGVATDISTSELRATRLLAYLRDPSSENTPHKFIEAMRRARPYKSWTSEIASVCNEVFWIFIHHSNTVPVPSPCQEGLTYRETHFPRPRAPVPLAPYVGGVEWEATQYLALHLDLLNGLICSLPTRTERNALRQELKDSGMEKVMGGSLRTCKDSFYAHVHAGLGTWVAASEDDGWVVRGVSEGVVDGGSPRKRREEPPKLKLDLELDLNGSEKEKGKVEGRVEALPRCRDDDGWF